MRALVPFLALLLFSLPVAADDAVQIFRNYGAATIALSKNECAKAPTALEFLQQQATAGNQAAREKLASAYYRGQTGTKQYEDALFWALVSEGSSPETSLIIKDVPKFISAQQVTAEEHRATEWKSTHPISKKGDVDNVFGMLCGKDARCKVADICGDLVGIDCDTLDDGPYLFASKSTKKIVASCAWGCKQPLEWTCGKAKRL